MIKKYNILVFRNRIKIWAAKVLVRNLKNLIKQFIKRIKTFIKFL